MNKINYGKQFIDNPDKVFLKKNLNNPFLTQGPIVKKFEDKICDYLKVNYAVTCNSGTSALLLALLSIDLKSGDNIIMPSVNFIASYNMSKFLKARILLADVNSSTGQMDPKNVVDCIKKNKLRKIKAIITMYLGGSPENIIDFFKLKKKYNFYLIEDACHAFGSEYLFKNKKLKIGSCKHSDISTFSFHPLKTITTGEGGAVTTNKYNLFNKIKTLRSHSIVKSKKIIGNIMQKVLVLTLD